MVRAAIAAALLAAVIAAIPQIPDMIRAVDGASVGEFVGGWVVQTSEATGEFLEEAEQNQIQVGEDGVPRIGGVDARELDLDDHEIGQLLQDTTWLEDLDDGRSALEALTEDAGSTGSEDSAAGADAPRVDLSADGATLAEAAAWVEHHLPDLSPQQQAAIAAELVGADLP